MQESQLTPKNIMNVISVFTIQMDKHISASGCDKFKATPWENGSFATSVVGTQTQVKLIKLVASKSFYR